MLIEFYLKISRLQLANPLFFNTLECRVWDCYSHFFNRMREGDKGRNAHVQRNCRAAGLGSDQHIHLKSH